MNQPIETTPEELFALIGEREFIKYKQQQELAKLYKQIEEMSKTIDELRKEVRDLTTPHAVDIKRG